jgi:hypothetical protein
MRARSPWTPGFAVALLALSARCAYDPNPASGTLKCSTATHTCPEGYTCDEASDSCIKNGEVDGGAAGRGTAGAAGGTAGTGGGAGGGIVGPAMFVGKWIFDSGSSDTVTCTDGSTKQNDLAADYVDVALNGGTLTATYFCDWNVTVASNATVIKPGQSCSRDMTDPTAGTTKFTWHGTTFTFATTNGKTATLSSTISSDYVDDASKTGCGTTLSCSGTCAIKIAGTLTKSP